MVSETLRRLNDELALADRRKNEFLAILGHELRNPLAPLRSALELILARLLRHDVEFSMPPLRAEYHGRRAVIGFLATRVLGPDRFRFVMTEVNGGPGFAVYKHGRFHAIQTVVLDRHGRITQIRAFLDEQLGPVFQLPARHAPA
jgi:signal transduction histidine kinase